MKKFFSKSISVFVALTIILSAAVFGFYGFINTVVADAVSEYNLSADARIMKLSNGEWIDTVKVLPGDTVKARLYIGTDYYAGHGEFIFFVDKNALSDDLALSTIYAGAVNPDYSFKYTTTVVKCDKTNVNVRRLVENGYVSSDFADAHYAYVLSFKIDSSNPVCQIYDSEKWLTEFEFTVNEGYTSDISLVILGETVKTPEKNYGKIDFSVGENGGRPSYAASMAAVDVAFSGSSSIVSPYTYVTFNANGGSFDDGELVKNVKASIGSDFSDVSYSAGYPEREGYDFVGWRNAPDTIGYDDFEVFAEWEAVEYYYYFDANGGTFSNGSSLIEGTLPYGASFGSIAVETPVRDGYNFLGWQYTDGVTVDLNSLYMGDEDLILIALWDTPEYKVTFVAGDKTIEQSFRVDSVIAVPDFAGYVINFWKDASGNPVSIPEKMPAQNLVFYADYDVVTPATGYDLSVQFDSDCFGTTAYINASDITSSAVSSGKVGSNTIPDKAKNEQGKYALPAMFLDVVSKDASGNAVAPSSGEKITVRMLIPAEYRTRKDFVLLHWTKSGAIESFSTKSSPANIVRDGDYLVFEVSELGYFGLYAVCDVEVINAPSKVNYKGNLNLSGVQLKIYENDGSVKYITDTSAMTVSGFNSKQIGTQTVMIESGGYCGEFEVTVAYAWWQQIIRILLLGFIWY